MSDFELIVAHLFADDLMVKAMFSDERIATQQTVVGGGGHRQLEPIGRQGQRSRYMERWSATRISSAITITRGWRSVRSIAIRDQTS